MKACARCGKSTHVITVRSHSMIATKRKQKPNLQRRTVDGKRVWLCTSCISVMTRADRQRSLRRQAPVPAAAHS
ncbi:MAG: L28 family ribosomal protein [bacterium]|nr:L28 family ribosomal protein [bacterium]